MRIGENQFDEHIRRFSHVLYLCHRNADPDAIGSANALCRAFGGTVGAVEDISRTGMALMDVIGVEVEINPRAEDYDLVVVVDTSVQLQLGSVSLSRYGVVDHHQDEGLLQDAEFYIQKPAKSTAEIVWTILIENGKKPSRETALGLLVGMISDTGRFRRSTPQSFRAAAELLEAGGFEYEEALAASPPATRTSAGRSGRGDSGRISTTGSTSSTFTSPLSGRGRRISPSWSGISSVGSTASWGRRSWVWTTRP